MPFRILKDDKGEFRISFTPIGLMMAVGYLATQILVLAGAYYTLQAKADAAALKADAAYKLADEKASKDETKHLAEADFAFDLRIKRTEDGLGKQLEEIRQDVKQIPRDLPRKQP